MARVVRRCPRTETPRGVIDLHCHILPEVDDGPGDMAGSVKLARALAQDGVRTVAATPHLREDFPTVIPSEIAGRCREVQDRIRASGVELEVRPGGEVGVTWGVEASDEELRLVSFAQRGTDLLLETPYGALPASFEELVFGFAVKGYRIVLAHPERNPSFQSEPARLADLVRRGALVQLTATSLTRTSRGSRPGRLAASLLKDGLAHVIASDSHGSHVPGRASIGAALEYARELVGSRASWMVTEAPAAVLAGEPLPPMPSGRRRRWQVRQVPRR
jgi:protein-tyrosine phosphatase